MLRLASNVVRRTVPAASTLSGPITVAQRAASARTMKIAVEGCCHGELDAIYRQIAALEQRNNYKVDVLLICGDFQAIRNPLDLGCMSVPDKYKQLGGFHKYYTGESVAPILTIVIGGNHEASNYFWELYHGGWLAPNIYFLGHAGCIRVNGIRIAGASGIFKPNDFALGHYERVPYTPGSMRSIYHTREYNIRRLSLLSSPDIILSHDWPTGIEHHGNLPALLRKKPHFRPDIEKMTLGSPALLGLLMALRPAWWFAAHMHVRFDALFAHDDGKSKDASDDQNGAGPRAVSAPPQNPDEIAIDFDDEGELDGAAPTTASAPTAPAPAAIPVAPVNTEGRNTDEIVLDDEEFEVEQLTNPEPASETAAQRTSQRAKTQFLALDKCLPRRDYLEVIDYPVPEPYASAAAAPSPPRLTFDPEWLAVTRAFNPLMSRTRAQPGFPDEPTARAMVATELAWVRANVYGADAVAPSSPVGAAPAQGEPPLEVLEKDVSDVQMFVTTAPGGDVGPRRGQPQFYRNPQTDAFCRLIRIENKVN